MQLCAHIIVHIIQQVVHNLTSSAYFFRQKTFKCKKICEKNYN